MAFSKEQRRLKIRKRIRRNVEGTTTQPRLAVYRSNKEIYAQLINDLDGKTIVASSSRDKDVKNGGTKVEIAAEVGKAIAKKAKDAGIEAVTFDRGGYLFHGRVKSLAEGAREGGLKF